MSDVFISHVEEDADIALEIALGLEQSGYTTWCYELDSLPGQSYLMRTRQAIQGCSAFVLLVSAQSLGSSQITREVIRAHESGKSFVPVLKGVTHSEFQARQPEWQEAIGSATSIRIPEKGLASVMPRIIEGLRVLGIPSSPQPDVERVDRIRATLGELLPYPMEGESKETAASTTPSPEYSRTPTQVTQGQQAESEAPFDTVPAGETASGTRRRRTKIAVMAVGSVVVVVATILAVVLLNGESAKPTDNQTGPPIDGGGDGNGVSAVVIGSFAAPGRETQGLAWDGTHLRAADNSNEVFKVDISGKTESSCPSPSPTPQGLTWDGTSFWIFTTNQGDIYQFLIDESGAMPGADIISQFRAPNLTVGGNNNGLAWDGANLWYSCYYKLYKLDTAGSVLGTLTFPNEIAGLAWDGEWLWVAYNAFPEKAVLSKIDSEGNVLLNVHCSVGHVDAMTWGDGRLWVAGTDSTVGGTGQMIYMIELATDAEGT